MASRTSGKGSPGTAGTAKPRAGRTAGPAKKAAPAKKTAAKKTVPVKRAPAKKAAARPAPRPAPSPTGGVYRLVRAVWLGAAHGVGAMFRGIGRGAKGLDPAHRKDGVALLLLGLALVIAAGTWSNLDGPVGDLVEMLITGAFGRLDLLVPILLGAVAVRLILHPERPEANGRIVIGLSALVVGVLGQVHIACGAPGRGDGTAAMQDAGGLIGWAASKPLVFLMGDVLAVPLLLLLTVFGLLVVTATPVTAIPHRLRALGAGWASSTRNPPTSSASGTTNGTRSSGVRRCPPDAGPPWSAADPPRSTTPKPPRSRHSPSAAAGPGGLPCSPVPAGRWTPWMSPPPLPPPWTGPC